MTSDQKFSIILAREVAEHHELERLMLANSIKFNKLVEKSQQSIKENRGIYYDEFWELVDELSIKKEESQGDK